MGPWDYLASWNSFNSADSVYFLQLLCKYEPKSVLRFLETFDSYRVEHCLRLCQEYGIVDAAAFLLERVGDAASALSLTLSGLNEKFVELENAVECLISELKLGASEGASLEQFGGALELKEVRTYIHNKYMCSIWRFLSLSHAVYDASGT